MSLVSAAARMAAILFMPSHRRQTLRTRDSMRRSYRTTEIRNRQLMQTSSITMTHVLCKSQIRSIDAFILLWSILTIHLLEYKKPSKTLI